MINNAKFRALLIATCITTCLSTAVLWITTLLYNHAVHPLSNIDYGTICGVVTANGENTSYFYSIIWKLFLYQVIVADLGFIFVVSVYFYRLKIIFDDTIYSLSKVNTLFFQLSIIFLIIIVGCIEYTIYIGDFLGGQRLWWSFVAYYVFISMYLCYLLTKQFSSIWKSKLNNSKTNQVSSNVCTPQVIASMLKIRKKFTVLTFFSVGFTVFALLFNILQHTMHPNEAYIMGWIYTTAFYLNNIVDILCISLQFTFDSKLYNCIYSTFCQRFEKLKMLQFEDNINNLVKENQPEIN